MNDEAPAVRCLQALERDLAQHLDFRPRADEDPVEIYVLDDRNAFNHFLKYHYPELPPRRAFFLKLGHQRVVYTYSSMRLEEDLRHEATHASLHGQYGNLPLWLDEGLAEYFENDLAQPGAERERIEQIAAELAGGWTPNLARLESLSNIHEMTPRDYREAWAWVHLFLNGPPPGKRALLGALADVTRNAGTLTLSDKDATNPRLLAHIKELQSRPLSAEPTSGEPSVRLQDAAVETPAGPSRDRAFWRRLRTWIGL